MKNFVWTGSWQGLEKQEKSI